MGNCGSEVSDVLGSCTCGQFQVNFGFIKVNLRTDRRTQGFINQIFFWHPHLYVRKYLVWILCRVL